MTPTELTTALKQEARRLGFDLAGAAPAIEPPMLDHLRKWLADGYAGGMHYLADRVEAYEHPRHVLEGARSVLMLAAVYRTVEPVPLAPGQGTVARYAWGDDYHDILRERLHKLADFHRCLVPTAAVRGVVDTAPLLERQFAQLAGLGWFGKNTMLLNQRLGSWFVLAALLTSESLDYDQPMEKSHCGTCRRCLDACPTGALVAPHVLDARRCISYLTIEQHAGQASQRDAGTSEDACPTAAELQQAIGARVFGCDACQEVCPWNRRAPVTSEPRFQPRPGMNPLDLAELLSLDEAAFRARFRGSALRRARRRGMLRNAAVALGNAASLGPVDQ